MVVSEFAKQAGKVKSTHLFAAMGKTTAAVGLGAALLFPLGGMNASAATGNKVIGGSQTAVTDAEGKQDQAEATGDYSTVSGGELNHANGNYSSVSGGSKNHATGESSSVSGGGDNIASGTKSSISGGKQNKATGEFSSVSGGDQNEAAGNQSTISGGTANKTTGDWSTIVGGAYNVAGGNSSLALGGMQSAVQGMYSVGIAGGSTSAAATQGFAAGYQSAVNVAYGTAIGYQAVANTTGTISFGHVKGDTYYASDFWDHTIGTNTFDDNYYNRLVNVADGIDDHDVVVMEQLTAAKAEAVATAKNQIKVKGDEKNVHAVEATDSDGVQTTTISLLPKVTLQDSTDTTGSKAVVLDGTAGTISAGLSTDAANYISLNGTAGLANIGAITIGKQPSYTYTYYVPVYDSNGNITSLSSTRTTESGNFITGLTNTTWTPGKYASGRAATEDQLEQAGRHFLSIKTGTKTNGTTIAENTLANYYNDGATGTYSLAFGVNTKSSGDYATSMGINSTASGLGALAVGYDNTASGTESVSVGTENKAAGNFSVALGVFANAGTANTDTSSTTNGAAVAVGFQASATKTGSSAYGYNAKAVQDEGTALGVSSVANVEGGVAVGAHSIADVAKGAKGYLAGDSDTSTTWVSTAGAMSLGGNTKDENGNAITVSRQLINLAAGTNDTDAVNVAQLKAVESEGLNFQGNNTDTTVHTNQGGTLQIQGSGTKASTEYSGENILVTGVSETADDGKTVTTKLNIGLDKNIRVDSVTAGQATTDSVQGYAGSVKIVGPSADSTQYEATSLTTAYDTSAKSVKDATVNRLQYTDGDGTTRHTVATLDDGLKLAGDAGTGTVNLDSTLAVTGGETNDANLASGKNIGVTASDGKLQIQLSKNLIGLSSITAGTVVMGSQSDGSDATKTGNYVTGLDNKNWTVGTTQAVSGRAATEDQLASVSTSLKSKTTGGFGLTADEADSTGSSDVKQDLGSTIKITAADDDNLTTTADTTDTAIKLALSKNLKLTSATYTDTAGNTTSVTGTGITIAKAGSTEGGRVSLTTTGLDNGGSQIVNVASGLGATALSDATGDTLNHAATIGDLKAAAQGATDSSDAKGLNFVGNSNPSDNSGKTTALHADLGGTVSILGTGTDEDANYSGRNVKVINKNNALYVELDKDLEARSMQVGYGENGNNIQGQLLLYGPNSDNTYSNLIVESQYMDGKPYLTNTTSNGDKRLVYKDGTDDALHTVATMSDGLKFSGDSGSTAAVTLGSMLAVTGGAAQDKLAKDTNNKLVTGNIGVVAAENADGTSGSLTLALARDINLGSQGSLTADSTKVGYQTATTKISRKTETGNYVTGLTNTNWTGTDYVSGRAATEDQLYQVSQSVQDTVNAATFSITAGGQGEATDATITKNVGQSIRIFGDAPKVSGGGDGDGWDRSKANILTKVKKDNKGDEYISVELQDHLEVGAHAGTDTDGTAITGVDGSMQFKGASAKEVNITGDTGIALSDNGNQTAALHQDNGAGYLDLTGTTAGTKASVSVHTGAKNLAKQDQTRLTYTDQSGKAHDVATLDDGLVFAGDAGTVSQALNSTVKISGGVSSTSDLSDGKNVGVVASSDGLAIKLAKDLTAIDSITGLKNTTIGPDFATQGRAATEEQLKLMQGSITQSAQGGGFGLTADGDGTKAAKADLGSTIGIHGDSNITTAVSEDGKSIDIKLNNQVDLGTDGSLKAGGVTINSSGIDAGNKNITNVASGIVNGDDSDNTNAANIGDVKTLAGEAAKTEIGKLGSRNFAGDDGETVSRGLGESMKLSGGADTTKLTDGNIGVVKNAAGDGLDIKLSSELTGLTSVTTGNSTLNNEGLTVNNSSGSAGTTVTGSGIKIAAGGEGTHAVEITNSNVSMGGQQIHDVAPGTQPTDAVNVSQLGGVVNGVTNAINTLGNRMNRVGAGASALAALHPLEFDPDEKWDFAAGFGHYKNANAAALGAFYRPNADTMVSIGGSFGGGENMLNAGVAWRIGKGTTMTISRVAMAKEIQKLKAVVEQQNEKLQENDTLRAQVEKQDKEIAELKAMVQQLAAKQ